MQIGPPTLRPSLVNPQQVFPLPDFALEAHALGNLKGRDDATLDVHAGPFQSVGITPSQAKQKARKRQTRPKIAPPFSRRVNYPLDTNVCVIARISLWIH